ncbi:MAG: hypothetical protein HY080_10760 [Gammaproteobacteria bacterium]|nr:hypothetical protein [Gammaproteobacteria bacterium]
MKMQVFNWPRSDSAAARAEESLPLLPYRQVYVHPCVINNKPHIVYPNGLHNQAPDLFSQLSRYYNNRGYALQEDRRVTADETHRQPERRHWAPIVLFTLSLLFENSAHADVEHENHDATPPSQQIEVQLISSQGVRHRLEPQPVRLGNPTPTVSMQIKSELANAVFVILQRHYKPQDNDPIYISDDLKVIANYYSDFPEVVAMLNRLADKNWQLVFDENNWVTVASGNIFQVDTAVVHFNTRSAAQLRLNNGCAHNPMCIASPADALLHELLHTHSMLVNSREFIAQGGMSHVLYPYQHEYAVIEAERKLYASMSRRDDIQRPQRVDHTGRLVKAHCPTCIN